MMSRRVPLLIAGASFAAIVYAAAVHIAANAVGFVMLMPDELNAYHMLVTFGFADAWSRYWTDLIGRFSAIGFLLGELWLVDRLAPSPWIGAIVARAINHLLVVAAFFAALRVGVRALGTGRSALLAVGALAAAHVAAGTVGIVGTWLLDHSIYFLSAATLPLVAAYVCRFAIEGFEPEDAIAFFAVYVLFLGAHEINLVPGGGVLALMAWVHWRRARVASADAASQERPFLVFCAILYGASAAAQVFSPSLGFRQSVWPSKMALFPDGIILGSKTLLSIAWQMLGTFPPTVAAVGLVGAALAIASGVVGRIELRAAAMFAALLCAMCAAVLFTMAMLSATIGYTRTETVYLPPHQRIYVALLFAACAAAVGSAAGCWIRREFLPMARERSAPVALAACVLALGILADPGHWRVARFLFADGAILYGEEGLGAARRTNNFSEYLRFDRQLRAPSTGRVAYLDEINHFSSPGHMFEATYRAYFESDAFGFSSIYRLREMIHLPCELGARKDACNGIAGRIEHRRVSASSPQSLESLLGAAQGVTRRIGSDGLRITATGTPGEHFVAFEGASEKGEVSLRIDARFADAAPGTRIVLHAVSDGVSASQPFDPTAAAFGPSAEFTPTARVHGASIRREADGSIRVRVGLALADAGRRFALRLQLADESYGTEFGDRPDLAVTVRALEISIVTP